MGINLFLIILVTSISSSLLGSFLVIRKMSMILDAISHTVFLGIIIGFLISKNARSNYLILLGIIAGIFTVMMIEFLVKKNYSEKEESIGIIFSLLYAISVIVVSNEKFKKVHLDQKSALLGQLVVSDLQKINLFGLEISRNLFFGIIILIFVLVFILVFYRQLKVISFDYILAKSFNFLPLIIHYILMSLVSVNAVINFNIMGVVMVISVMVTGPMISLLFTKKLKLLLIYSIIINFLTSILGYFLADSFSLPPARFIASLNLLLFLILIFFIPKKGIIVKVISKLKLKKTYAKLFILQNIDENKLDNIINKENILNQLLKEELINIKNSRYFITDKGVIYLQNYLNNVKL